MITCAVGKGSPNNTNRFGFLSDDQQTQQSERLTACINGGDVSAIGTQMEATDINNQPQWQCPSPADRQVYGVSHQDKRNLSSTWRSLAGKRSFM